MSILILMMSFSAFAAPAETNESIVSPPQNILKASNTPSPWKLAGGINIYEFDYKEEFKPPFKSTESGLLIGIQLGLLYEPEKGEGGAIGYSLMAELSPSETNYDGSATDRQGNVFPRLGTTSNQFANVEGNINLPVTVGLSAYSGLGYHIWQRDLLGEGGYREIYRWFYLPIGLRANMPLGSSVSIGVDGEIKIMFGGTMTAYLDNVPEFALGSRVGTKIQIPFTFKTSAALTFSVAPWFEYSAIGESNVVVFRQDDGRYSGYQEPDSRTYQYGISFGLASAL